MQSMQSSIHRTAIAGNGLNAESGDFAAKMVGMNQGSIEAKVSANVIKTGDEMLGTLIDLRA
jgi:flagellar hook protein FlgE